MNKLVIFWIIRYSNKFLAFTSLHVQQIVVCDFAGCFTSVFQAQKQTEGMFDFLKKKKYAKNMPKFIFLLKNHTKFPRTEYKNIGV